MLLLRTNAASAPASSSASRRSAVSFLIEYFSKPRNIFLGSSCCAGQEEEAVELQQIEGDGISQGQVAINMESAYREMEDKAHQGSKDGMHRCISD